MSNRERRNGRHARNGLGHAPSESLFDMCLHEMQDGLSRDPPGAMTMTDEETARATAAVYASICWRQEPPLPPLPRCFLDLPAAEQLARWREAVDRGDFDPCGLLTGTAEADATSCVAEGAEAEVPPEADCLAYGSSEQAGEPGDGVGFWVENRSLF